MRRIRNYLTGRRHRLWIVGGATVAAVGLGIGVGALTSGSASLSTQASAVVPTTTVSPTSPSTAAPALSNTKGTTHQHRRGVRGTITAIEGNTWTVDTVSGKTVTVNITSTTKFAKRAVQSSLAVGAKVVVIGPRSATTITATSVHLSHVGAGAQATTPTLPAS